MMRWVIRVEVFACWLAWFWLFLLALARYEGPILVPIFFTIGIVVYHAMLAVDAVAGWLWRLISGRRSCASEHAPDRVR